MAPKVFRGWKRVGQTKKLVGHACQMMPNEFAKCLFAVLHGQHEVLHGNWELIARTTTLKRSPFSLGRRKNKNEFDLDDYVCPMNSNEKLFGSMLLNGAENRTEEEKFLMKEMVLKNDKILESMPASNV
ncbi:hypothetical protein AVEN_172192-1 [Araneus ventricosus]|uniref:Uncharacterized protein n=1 Tax=Araneus ventricosus TaxID=182803 RepID=A0A4Y2PDV2_ARAVE|nr:hypothetical protein AVEN_172192-1 [Araneus ventricosus]